MWLCTWCLFARRMKAPFRQGLFLIGYPEVIPVGGVQYVYWMDGDEGGIEMGNWMDEDLQTRSHRLNIYWELFVLMGTKQGQSSS